MGTARYSYNVLFESSASNLVWHISFIVLEHESYAYIRDLGFNYIELYINFKAKQISIISYSKQCNSNLSKQYAKPKVFEHKRKRRERTSFPFHSIPSNAKFPHLPIDSAEIRQNEVENYDTTAPMSRVCRSDDRFKAAFTVAWTVMAAREGRRRK